jgi:hypothetical protein
MKYSGIMSPSFEIHTQDIMVRGGVNASRRKKLLHERTNVL